MKLFVTLMVAAALGFIAAWFTVANQLSRQHAAKEAAWRQEKERLLAQIETARRNRPAPVNVQAPVTSAEPTIPNNASAAEIMERLKTFRIGAGQGRSARQLIYYFESLAELGA